MPLSHFSHSYIQNPQLDSRNVACSILTESEAHLTCLVTLAEGSDTFIILLLLVGEDSHLAVSPLERKLWLNGRLVIESRQAVIEIVNGLCNCVC